MSQIHWLNPIDGSFTNPSDWSGGTVPGASDDAILDAVGSAFTVTSDVNETVDSVQLASNATLTLTAGTFTAQHGTGSGANAGVILIGAGATMLAGRVVTNTGTIALDGTGKNNSAELSFSGFSTLTGGGEILLEGQAGDLIGADPGNGAALYNVDNTIVGSGKFAKHVQLVNEQAGTIDANGSTPLVVAGNVANAGLVEATGSGGLIFNTIELGNSATGVILAGDGSKVQLVASYLFGGTLESAGSGVFIASDETEIGGPTGNPTIIDANVKAVGSCVLFQTIENNGVISLAKGSIILGPVATLEGDGVIDLGGRTISGYGSTLTLASGAISGPGFVSGSGSEPLHLTLGSAGVIDSNAATGLTLDTFTSIVNAGTIESTGAGGVVVEGAIVNSGTLSVAGGGTFVAEGAVTGKGVATIDGGALEFLSSFSEAVTFTGAGTLELAQSQGFTKSVTGFSATGTTTLDLGDIGFVNSDEATYTGSKKSGVLTVTDGTHTAQITLKGNYLNATFVASSDGHGGTEVVAQRTAPAFTTPHAFVSAMAGLGGPAGGAIHGGEGWSSREPVLVTPRPMMA